MGLLRRRGKQEEVAVDDGGGDVAELAPVVLGVVAELLEGISEIVREESREALLGALENARSIVSRSLDDLRSEGVPLEELIGDAAPG